MGYDFLANYYFFISIYNLYVLINGEGFHYFDLSRLTPGYPEDDIVEAVTLFLSTTDCI